MNDIKPTESIVLRGLTFSIGDRVRYARKKGVYSGIITMIDATGLNGSHLFVREEGGTMCYWVHDEWIIIPDNPTVTIFKLKNNPPPKDSPVTFWCGKVVLYRETPVTIKREVYGTGTEPYAEGFDDEGRYYKFRLDELEKLAKPIEGIVKHGRNK